MKDFDNWREGRRAGKSRERLDSRLVVGRVGQEDRRGRQDVMEGETRQVTAHGGVAGVKSPSLPPWVSVQF